MVTTYETLGGSVFSRFEERNPDRMRARGFVDSGFVTPEGESIFVPAEDMNERAS